ncbi:hypothetical protein M422DRAFT_260624 [Sphaerobolus stellatus SS14]|uniref:Uncharacterized protein n=1 Tax=Sphaerobolus stellatus (strain SS14) TaxID=990650 RepID=A0A0C9UQK8_SPHS4|nr:hypothetical protein M422DRAFT_260624 [Sphaerobolus stellatus SS14]
MRPSKEFQIHQLTSKKSAYDFCEGLVRHTDMQSPNLGKSRYNKFLRVSRVWNHLSTLKRSGQLHGIDKLLPHRTSGSTAVRCPAFPEEHFNLTSNFIKEEDGTKAKANKDRWEEEIDILEEEFQRTKRSFARMEQVWKALAHVCDHTAEGWGKHAYAHQQVGMYQLLNKRTHADFLKTKSHKPIPALTAFVAV